MTLQEARDKVWADESIWLEREFGMLVSGDEFYRLSFERTTAAHYRVLAVLISEVARQLVSWKAS